MDRLTTSKDVKDMNMCELAYNCCYAKDGLARFRDYETDIDARELIINLLKEYIDDSVEFESDDEFDEFMLDSLQYSVESLVGFIAVFYKNVWAMAELRERLKTYEDAEEDGKLIKLPFGIGTPIYKVCYAPQINDGFVYETTMSLKFYADNISEFEEGLMYSDKDKAEQALQKLKEGAEIDG